MNEKLSATDAKRLRDIAEYLHRDGYREIVKTLLLVAERIEQTVPPMPGGADSRDSK